jgi:hypothetical protein
MTSSNFAAPANNRLTANSSAARLPDHRLWPREQPSSENEQSEQPAEKGVEQRYRERPRQDLSLTSGKLHGGSRGDDVVRADDIADRGAEALSADKSQGGKPKAFGGDELENP